MSDQAEIPEEVKIFLVESYENLERMEQDLIALERAPNDKETLNRVFRVVHTVKGNSGFLGFKQLETVCHRGEAVLDALRAGRIALTPDLTSTLLELIDHLRQSFGEIEQLGTEGATNAKVIIEKFAQVKL